MSQRFRWHIKMAFEQEIAALNVQYKFSRLGATEDSQELGAREAQTETGEVIAVEIKLHCRGLPAVMAPQHMTCAGTAKSQAPTDEMQQLHQSKCHG